MKKMDVSCFCRCVFLLRVFIHKTKPASVSYEPAPFFLLQIMKMYLHGKQMDDLGRYETAAP